MRQKLRPTSRGVQSTREWRVRERSLDAIPPGKLISRVQLLSRREKALTYRRRNGYLIHPKGPGFRDTGLGFYGTTPVARQIGILIERVVLKPVNHPRKSFRMSGTCTATLNTPRGNFIVWSFPLDCRVQIWHFQNCSYPRESWTIKGHCR